MFTHIDEWLLAQHQKLVDFLGLPIRKLSSFLLEGALVSFLLGNMLSPNPMTPVGIVMTVLISAMIVHLIRVARNGNLEKLSQMSTNIQVTRIVLVAIAVIRFLFLLLTIVVGAFQPASLFAALTDVLAMSALYVSASKPPPEPRKRHSFKPSLQ